MMFYTVIIILYDVLKATKNSVYTRTQNYFFNYLIWQVPPLNLSKTYPNCWL